MTLWQNKCTIAIIHVYPEDLWLLYLLIQEFLVHLNCFHVAYTIEMNCPSFAQFDICSLRLHSHCFNSCCSTNLSLSATVRQGPENGLDSYLFTGQWLRTTFRLHLAAILWTHWKWITTIHSGATHNSYKLCNSLIHNILAPVTQVKLNLLLCDFSD